MLFLIIVKVSLEVLQTLAFENPVYGIDDYLLESWYLLSLRDRVENKGNQELDQ